MFSIKNVVFVCVHRLDNVPLFTLRVMFVCELLVLFVYLGVPQFVRVVRVNVRFTQISSVATDITSSYKHWTVIIAFTVNTYIDYISVCGVHSYSIPAFILFYFVLTRACKRACRMKTMAFID